jgi:hypothetical protein
MISNKELEAGLKAMAEDFHLPGGARKKLSRLAAEHLWWFDAAEQRGMSWRDMIRALTAAGVMGKRTKPVSVGALSSTVWRARTMTAVEAARAFKDGRDRKPSDRVGNRGGAQSANHPSRRSKTDEGHLHKMWMILGPADLCPIGPVAKRL